MGINSEQRNIWSEVKFVLCPVKIFLKADMILCLVKQFLEASRQNKRAEFTESRKSFTPNMWPENKGCKGKQKIIWGDFIDCRFNVCLMEKRERSELILLAVCLVIWFSPIFRLLSLVVVTDAVSGLTTAISISTPPSSLTEILGFSPDT